MSNRFFENQPNEICSHLSEKASHGRFLKPDKLQNHSNEGKGKEKEKKRAGRKKVGEEKKAMVALLVFILATLESFWPKKLLDAKDPFGDNVFKNPARCTRSLIGYSSCDDTTPFCGSTQTLVPKHHVWTAPKSLET